MISEHSTSDSGTTGSPTPARSFGPTRPDKLEQWLDIWRVPSTLTFIALTFSVTAISLVVNAHVLQSETLTRAGSIGAWLLVIFNLLSATATWFTSHAIRNDLLSQKTWLVTNNIVGMVWLLLLAWFSSFPIAIVVALLWVSTLINDVRVLYDAPHVYVSNLVPIPLTYLLLLALDLFGQPGLGLRATLAEDGAHFWGMTGSLAILMPVTAAVIWGVGANVRKHDNLLLKFAAKEAQIDWMLREREVLMSYTNLLAPGLAAAKYSHDLASPLTVLHLSLNELRELPSHHAQLDEPLQDAIEACDQLQHMIKGMTRAVKSDMAVARTALHELVDQAWEEACGQLQGHGITPLQPVIHLDSTSVWVTDEHAGAIGCVLVNGTLQRPDRALEITGSPVGDWHYQIHIRDHGVPRAQAGEALGKIRHRLSLRHEQTSRSFNRQYRGFGLGLTLSKLLLVRNHGWLDCRAPDEGDGVIIDVTLPITPPQDMPSDAVSFLLGPSNA